jgi:hypothetical protein
MGLEFDRTCWPDRRNEFWKIPHDLAKRGGLFMTMAAA